MLQDSQALDRDLTNRNLNSGLISLDLVDDLVVIGCCNGNVEFYLQSVGIFKHFRTISPSLEDQRLKSRVTCIKISKTKKYLALGNTNGRVIVCELGSDEFIKIICEYDEHCGSEIVSMAWSYDCLRFYSGSSNGILVEAKIGVSTQRLGISLPFSSIPFFHEQKQRILYQDMNDAIVKLETISQFYDDEIIDLVLVTTNARCLLYRLFRRNEDLSSLQEISSITSEDSSSSLPATTATFFCDESGHVSCISYVQTNPTSSMQEVLYYDIFHNSHGIVKTSFPKEMAESQKECPIRSITGFRNQLHAHTFLGISPSNQLLLISRSQTHPVNINSNSNSSEISSNNIKTFELIVEFINPLCDIASLSISNNICLLVHLDGRISCLHLPLPTTSLHRPIRVHSYSDIVPRIITLQRSWRKSRRGRQRSQPGVGGGGNGVKTGATSSSKMWSFQNILQKTKADLKAHVNQSLSVLNTQLSGLRWPAGDGYEEGIQGNDGNHHGSADWSGEEGVDSSWRDTRATEEAYAGPTTVTKTTTPLLQPPPVSRASLASVAPTSSSLPTDLRLDISKPVTKTSYGHRSQEDSSEDNLNEGLTEGEDDDQDANTDGGGLFTDCWFTVGEVSWREKWWDASNTVSSTQGLRDRIMSQQRFYNNRDMNTTRKKYKTVVAIEPIISSTNSQKTPLSSHISASALVGPGRISSSEKIEGETVSVVHNDDALPNTFELRLQPHRVHGVGLQLLLLTNGYCCVKGFVRHRRDISDFTSGGGDKEWIEDVRGTAERSGLITVGDVLVAVNGVELSTVGLEQILLILQQLETEREEPVQLRFMYGDLCEPQGAASAALLNSEAFPDDPTENIIIEAFPLGGRESSKKKPGSPVGGLRQEGFNLGIAAWLDGEVFVSEEEQTKGNTDVAMMSFDMQDTSEAVNHGLKKRSLYPSVYPSPCMQQRGEMSWIKLLPSLAEEARPWVQARSRSRRFKRDRSLISKPLAERKKKSGAVSPLASCIVIPQGKPLHIDPKDFIQSVQLMERQSALERIGRNRAWTMKGNTTKSHNDPQTEPPERRLDECEPSLSVKWKGCFWSDSNDLSVNDVDKYVNKLIQQLQKKAVDGGASQSDQVKSPKKFLGALSFGSVMISQASMSAMTAPSSASNISSSKASSIASKNMPPATITTSIHRILSQGSVDILNDTLVETLLSAWIHSFLPVSITQREWLRPRVISAALSQTLGFTSPNAMAELVGATEDIVTLYFVMKTCLSFLAYDIESNRRSETGIDAQQETSRYSTSILKVLMTFRMRFQYTEHDEVMKDSLLISQKTQTWSKEQSEEFLRTFGAYVNVDTALAASQIVKYDSCINVLETILSTDTAFQNVSIDFGSALRNDPRVFDCDTLMRLVVHGYGESFSYLLSLLFLHIRSLFSRSIELAVETCVAMFPLIAPWSVKRALLGVVDEEPHTPILTTCISERGEDHRNVSLPSQFVFFVYMKQFLCEFPEYIQIQSFILEFVQSALEEMNTVDSDEGVVDSRFLSELFGSLPPSETSSRSQAAKVSLGMVLESNDFRAPLAAVVIDVMKSYKHFDGILDIIARHLHNRIAIHKNGISFGLTENEKFHYVQSQELLSLEFTQSLLVDIGKNILSMSNNHREQFILTFSNICRLLYTSLSLVCLETNGGSEDSVHARFTDSILTIIRCEGESNDGPNELEQFLECVLYDAFGSERCLKFMRILCEAGFII